MTRISVKVVPKSRHSALKFYGNGLKAWLRSVPEDGRANDELLRTLADKLNVSLSSVKIIRGFSSKNKVVDISGISLEEIEKSAG